MLYECKWDNYPSKSQFIKVNHYRSRYCLKHGAHTELQAIKGSKKDSSKTILLGKPRIYYRYKTNNNYWTSDSWIRIGANNCSGFKRLNRYQTHPILKQPFHFTVWFYSSRDLTHNLPNSTLEHSSGWIT